MLLWAVSVVVGVREFPSLLRASTSTGKRAVGKVFALVLALRALKHLRKVAERIPVVVVPLATLGALAARALAKAVCGRRAVNIARQLLRAVLVVGSALSINDSLQDWGNADHAALVGMVLGILLGEDSAAAVLLFMLTGGEALEEYAEQRAGGSVHSLIAAKANPDAVLVPQNTSLDETTTWEQVEAASNVVPTSSLRPGDTILLRSGSTVPLDCVVLDFPRMSSATGARTVRAVVGEGALTGESGTTGKVPGDTLLSGTPVHSAGGTFVEGDAAATVAPCPLVLARALRPASDSTFALMQKALREALHERSKAPLELRSATYGRLFTPLAFFVASLGLARVTGLGLFRATSADVGMRGWRCALSVLMAATPCPLTIGVPVAFLSGISVAARAGLTVRGGAALERLASCTLLALDKTGTLTEGKPSLVSVGVPKGGGGGLYPLATVLLGNEDDGDDGSGAVFVEKASGIPAEKENRASKLKLEHLAHSLACAAEFCSSHVVADALRRPALARKGNRAEWERDRRAWGYRCRPVGDAVEVPGMGVECEVHVALSKPIEPVSGAGQGSSDTDTTFPTVLGEARCKVTFGSRAFLESRGCEIPPHLSEEVVAAASGGSVMHVHLAVDGYYAATLSFSDSIRGEARALVAWAVKAGIRVAILSGDGSSSGKARAQETTEEAGRERASEKTETSVTHSHVRGGRVRDVGALLGVPASHCHVCLPHEKAELISRWRSEGECVVMVGDGTNDAAALAAADAGISLGTNALASEGADAILLSRDLRGVSRAIEVSRYAVSVAQLGVTMGMGASIAQMSAAAVGILPEPAVSAWLQEAVDLGAILNSMRVLFVDLF